VGQHVWTRRFGTSGSDFGNAAAVNASGVYVTGPVYYWIGSPDNTFRDVLVRAYDHAGNHRWTRRFGPSGADYRKGVAVDAAGVYVVGETAGAFPGWTNQGETDVFVRKYDHNGKVAWTRRFGTSSTDSGQGVTVNASGVYVTGETRGAFPGWINQGRVDVFVRAYSHAGKHLWTRQFGTTSYDAGLGVAATPAALYVTGDTWETLPGQTSQGGIDAFVRKYATG
jgi:Tfp pilus assembly protein PilZ